MNSIDQHTIDEYLLNRLDNDDLNAIEQLLAKDEALAAEVAEQRQAIVALSLIGDIQMKERVRRIHLAEIGQGNKPTVTTSPRKWIFALILLLVASLAIWWVLRPKAQTPHQLYAQYYIAYDLSFGSRDTEAAQALAEAGNLYKSGKYGEALPLFEQVLVTNPSDSKARLAAGICQLELGKYDQALVQFNALMDANDPLFGEQAIWYAAMVRLKQGNVSQTKALLEKLTSNSPESALAADAQNLLKELND